jgi:hypothetical protein
MAGKITSRLKHPDYESGCFRTIELCGSTCNSMVVQGVCSVQGLRSLIDKTNASDEKRAAETFRFMEEQKIRKALAPNEWEKLKDTLIRECITFSQSTEHALLSDTLGINELVLRNARTGKSVKFTYGADMPCVFYEGDERGHFAFRPSADGMTLQWFDPRYNRIITIEDIVFETTKYLIK